MQGVWVPFLVRKLRSLMQLGANTHTHTHTCEISEGRSEMQEGIVIKELL